MESYDLEEYKMLRDEIQSCIERDNSLATFMVTAVATILTVAISANLQVPFLFLISFCIIIPFSARLAHYKSNVARISAYMIVYLEPKMSIKYETNAIKYAYTSKRVDSKGAVYNPSRDMIALPVKITQNYLMSDFKAALIGGASFDNDSFVRGTSAGIFIQDNDKIAQNVVHKLCDYIYNVPLDKIDPKNSIYIEAYKKIIRYLYNIDSSVTKINDLYNNIGTSLLSDYGIVVLSPDMINNSENNEHYNINAQDEKYIQVSYIDDFAIQLKRFGEYNYKYFYSHQELISEDSGSSDNWNENNVTSDREPQLLGSLVYDKEWIDNKMEE